MNTVVRADAGQHWRQAIDRYKNGVDLDPEQVLITAVINAPDSTEDERREAMRRLEWLEDMIRADEERVYLEDTGVDPDEAYNWFLARMGEDEESVSESRWAISDFADRVVTKKALQLYHPPRSTARSRSQCGDLRRRSGHRGAPARRPSTRRTNRNTSGSSGSDSEGESDLALAGAASLRRSSRPHVFASVARTGARR